jgi:hypothetical protein
MRWAVARPRRVLAGLMPAALLAGALALAAPATVDAASPKAAAVSTTTHPVPPKGKPLTRGSGVKPVHAAHGRPAHHGIQPPPAPAPITQPGSAPTAATLHPLTFDTGAGVVETVGRTGATAPGVAPLGVLRSAPSSLGGILPLPQGPLFGDRGGAGGDSIAAAGPWQVIAVAEAVALLALLATVARRRRVSGRPIR